jgi:hypothetical protein
MDEQALRDQAVRQLRRKREFWTDVVAYVVVNAFLIGIWYFVGERGYFWPGWVMAGWGIGLVLHAWEVFGRRPITDEQVRHEMERQRQRGVVDLGDKDEDRDT